jgi:hypothetical protein
MNWAKNSDNAFIQVISRKCYKSGTKNCMTQILDSINEWFDEQFFFDLFKRFF